MKVLIDISEDVFTRLFDNGVDASIDDLRQLEMAVRKGTPIPEEKSAAAKIFFATNKLGGNNPRTDDEMTTISQAEEVLRSIRPYQYNIPAAKIEKAKKTILDAIKGGAHIANYYGMTVEAERRVMRNAVQLIREVVDDFVFGCGSGSDDWREFFTGYSDEFDETVEKAAFPSDFCYHLPSDEWLFKSLISYGTRRGGMGSACEECRKIGKILMEENNG